MNNMKKLLLIPALFLAACNTGEPLPVDIKESTLTGEISIIVIDSCEYVKFAGYNKGSVCHKGNCKNPIHWKVITR